jgi:hypothetical protein
VRIEITRELDADCDALEVPWDSPSDPSLRYWDLKLHPEKIAGLPECRNFPAMADCLAKFNAPSSPLRSAKCDVWCTTDLAEDERLDFNLPFKTGSYLDVVFDDLERRKSVDAHARLAEEFQRRLSALRVQAQMEIVLRRCLFHPQETWGYALTLFLHAYSSTQAEATAEWSRSIAAVGMALPEA